MVARMEIEDDPLVMVEQPQVELNHASIEELTTLSGIGPNLAQRIVDYREANGPFLFASDIQRVSGIGNAQYETIADRLTVTVPTPAELTNATTAGDVVPEDDARPDVDTTPGDDAQTMKLTSPDEPVISEPEIPPESPATPPPLPVSAIAQSTVAEPVEKPAYQTPPPLPVSAMQQTAEEGIEPPESVLPEVEPTDTEPEEVPPVLPVPEQEPPARDVRPRQRRFGWVWTALLGAVLGALLGMLLSLAIFAGINGSIDINRSQAMVQMRGQLNELDIELDAVKGDVSTLQGDVGGLRERVEVLSGLTARMEQAEDALQAFTVEIQALQDETAELTASLDTLTTDVETMGETLDAVEAQTEKATSFFEGLQILLQDVFGQQPEPESSVPLTAVEVDV